MANLPPVHVPSEVVHTVECAFKDKWEGLLVDSLVACRCC